MSDQQKAPEVCRVDKDKLENPTCPEWEQRMQLNQRRLKEINETESYLMGELEKIKARLEDIRREAAMLMAGQEAASVALRSYTNWLRGDSPKNPDASSGQNGLTAGELQKHLDDRTASPSNK